VSGLEAIGRSYAWDRELFVIAIDGLADWPQSLTLPSKNFVLFVAADKPSTDGMLTDFAATTLAQGACYVTTWGTDAARVETFFDLAAVARGTVNDNDLVMTTSHANETLEEALFFAVTLAMPAAAYEETCNALVAAAVGSNELAVRVRAVLQETSLL
jgi:hypothetical protein